MAQQRGARPQPTVDYGALAKKHGGIDYSALASKYGGSDVGSVTATRIPPTSPATGESLSRDLSPGGLAGRLTDEALTTLLGPFSARTAADASGKTQWQVPPIITGAFDVINALGAPASPVRRPGQPLPAVQTPRQQQRETMAAKDTETMSGLVHAPLAPIRQLPTVARGAGALIAPSIVNPPTPEATVEAAREMPGALTATIPTIMGAMALRKPITEAAQTIGGALRESAPVTRILGEPVNPAHKRLESLNKVWPEATKINAGLTDEAGALLAGEEPAAMAGERPLGFLRQAARQMGIDPSDIATGGGIEQLNLGTSKTAYNKIRQNLGSESLGPVVKEMADQAVAISDQTISQAIDVFGDSPMRAQQAEIVSRLRAKAASEAHSGNTGKASSLERYADQMEATDGTGRGINSVKVDANARMAEAKKNPTAQARADESPIAAHEEAGSIIREVLYPELEKMAGVDRGTFIRAGVAEHGTMKLRDAIYENYDNLVAAGRPNVLQKVGQAAQAYLTPRQTMIRGALKSPSTAPQTMAQFNKAIRDALAKLDQDAPLEQPQIRPSPTYLPPVEVPNPYGVGTRRTGTGAPSIAPPSNPAIDPVTGLPLRIKTPEGYGFVRPPRR